MPTTTTIKMHTYIHMHAQCSHYEQLHTSRKRQHFETITRLASSVNLADSEKVSQLFRV